MKWSGMFIITDGKIVWEWVNPSDKNIGTVGAFGPYCKRFDLIDYGDMYTVVEWDDETV